MLPEQTNSRQSRLARKSSSSTVACHNILMRSCYRCYKLSHPQFCQIKGPLDEMELTSDTLNEAKYLRLYRHKFWAWGAPTTILLKEHRSNRIPKAILPHQQSSVSLQPYQRSFFLQLREINTETTTRHNARSYQRQETLNTKLNVFTKLLSSKLRDQFEDEADQL